MAMHEIGQCSETSPRSVGDAFLASKPLDSEAHFQETLSSWPSRLAFPPIVLKTATKLAEAHKHSRDTKPTTSVASFQTQPKPGSRPRVLPYLPKIFAGRGTIRASCYCMRTVPWSGHTDFTPSVACDLVRLLDLPMWKFC